MEPKKYINSAKIEKAVRIIARLTAIIFLSYQAWRGVPDLSSGLRLLEVIGLLYIFFYS